MTRIALIAAFAVTAPGLALASATVTAIEDLRRNSVVTVQGTVDPCARYWATSSAGSWGTGPHHTGVAVRTDAVARSDAGPTVTVRDTGSMRST